MGERGRVGVCAAALGLALAATGARAGEYARIRAPLIAIACSHQDARLAVLPFP